MWMDEKKIKVKQILLLEKKQLRFTKNMEFYVQEFFKLEYIGPAFS
jgi:hypothetical protein